MSFTADLKEVVAENRNGQLDTHATWNRVRLSEVASVLNGFPFESDHFNGEAGHPLIRIRDVIRGSTGTLYAGEVPEGFWIHSGQILVGMDGDFNVARWKSSNALLNQRVLRLESLDKDLYDEGFLFHVIGGYLNAINEYTSSVTVKHLSSKTVLAIPLPLPPIAEQKRIAQKLDALTAQVDTLKSRIDTITESIRHIRMSALANAAAIGGNQHSLLEGTASATGLSFKLGDEAFIMPQGWTFAPLGALLDPSRKLCYGVVQPGAEVDSGVDMIRVCDIRDGKISWSDLRKISYDVDADYRRSRVVKGDVLLSIVGSIGRAAIIREDRPANIARAVARLSVDRSRLSPEWAFLWLTCPQVQWWLVSSSKEVARKTLNLKELGELPVPLPPPATQAEIVHRVEQLFAFADQLEAKVATAKKRIDALTHSLLAKAFRGELVQQEPGDEPASVLLERIQAQRTNAREVRRGHNAP